MANENILVIDDDEDIRESITLCLEKEGMRVTAVEEGKKAIPLLQNSIYHLVILDLILKDADGFDILKQIRRLWPDLPVLILSGRQEEEKKAIGFELEADDYLTKPYSSMELIARIKRHIRRYRGYDRPPDCEVLCLGHLQLDLKKCLLFKKNREIPLPARLFKILKFFMENPGQVLSKEQIYDRCWDDSYYDENTVKVYIRKLRKSIEDDPDNPRYIKTIIGLGYRFSSE